MAIKKSDLYSSLWASCDELRGGMDASQYKDYVLVLLFMKYVSDKAQSQKNYLLDVPKGENIILRTMTGSTFQRVLKDNASGSTATGIQRRRLETLELNLPPVVEQIAIAAILSDMDAELAALEQRRDKTRLLKQGMMQELLTGRTRLI